MTKEQIREIEDSLTKWRVARKLSIQEQHKGLLANLLEEFREYVLAQDDFEKVDALCDVLVLAGNANMLNWDTLDYTTKTTEEYLADSVANIAKNVPITADGIVRRINKLGFDPFIAMQETLKEIHSRVGKWDDEKKKFIKDTSDEARAKWYKADYKKALIANKTR